MSIVIPIISEFNNKGFKQAEKQASLLDKSFKKLGVTLGATFSARKIAQFTKASVRAFLEEDKAVRALGQNLSNLGLAYDVKPIEAYIRQLQYSTGVADGELRPALQQLAGATKDLALSQELLNLALDISAGTGKSLASVTQALSRAYLGTNTSLSRLNIGLTKTELTTKSFNEITKELTDRFSGQAAKAAGTYAGQLAILAAAGQDAQEILGEKLVKSVELLLDENKGVPALAKSFEDVAIYVGNVAVGMASVVALYKKLPMTGKSSGSNFAKGLITTLFPALQGVDILQQLGSKEVTKQQAKADAIARANAKESGMARSRALRDEKKITDEKLKQSKIDKDKLKLQAASSVFDDEKISIAAALQNEALDRNEILRLELKKALINENADRAEKLAKALNESQKELASLQAFRLANPFQAWEDSLNKIRSGVSSLGVPVAPISPQGTITGQVPSVPSIVPPGQGGYIPPSITQEDLYDAFGGRGIAGAGVMAPTININVSGTGNLSDDTKKAVVDAVVEASSAGFATGWFRTTGNYTIS